MTTRHRRQGQALLALLGCAGALGMARAAAAPTSEPGEADRVAIRAHIDRIFKAYIEKDRGVVRATHDRDWRGFLIGSPSIIKGIDQYMRAADNSLQSPQRLLGYRMEELDVQFRGDDIAIVPYVAELSREVAGSPKSYKLRVIDVYQRQGGDWMQVASNTALHPQSIFEQSSHLQPLTASGRRSLLEARETVWRAWFSGDEAALRRLLPEETLALDPDGWMTRDAIIKSSLEFARGGGRLVRLEYPRTEIQAYGATAILYTGYLFETEAGGKRQMQTGKAVEIFVRRRQGWLNAGWQLAPDPPRRPGPEAG